MNICVTVDVEKDVGAVNSCYGINEGLPFILDMLEAYNIKGTFFISGEILEYLDRKNFLQRIVDQGHEIASHGYNHYDYRDFTFEEICFELDLSKRILEQYTGENIIGYRSPQFRVNEKILRAIAEVGFKYDSSIPDPAGISAASLLRNVNFCSKDIDIIEKKYIKEFVITSMPIIKFPHGIFWVNLIGKKVYKKIFKRFEQDIVVFYMHPFDFIDNKGRVNCPTLLENICYKIKELSSKDIFRELINFWISENVKFLTLQECYLK